MCDDPSLYPLYCPLSEIPNALFPPSAGTDGVWVVSCTHLTLDTTPDVA